MSSSERSAIRLPDGVRDYLPAAAARRRAIAERLIATFERWGYRRIITPAFEYEAVLARGLGDGAAAMVRFVEPSSGEVVALRPDITPQVARLVATRLAGERGPLRLAYEGSVIRLGGTRGRELFQAGVELIHAPSPAGDVEAIALAAASLESTGLTRFAIDLGDAAVARAALDRIADGHALHEAVARKDPEGVAREARALGLPAPRRRLLEALPSLHGDAAVIDRAASLLAKGHRTARAQLATLDTVVRRLDGLGLAPRITIDLGEVRGFDYYTGVRFQGFAPGAGDALLSGGRYDRLVERYGAPARAAGFAVDVERVALALRASRPDEATDRTGTLVAGDPVLAARAAAALRATGERAVLELDDGLTDRALVERARRADLARVLVVQRRGSRRLSVVR